MTTMLSDNTVVQGIVSRLMNGSDHLSYSSLSAFKSSPREFIEYKTGQKEQTDAMIYGSMVHCLVLEPSEFDKRYHAIDDEDICLQIGGPKPRATKAYKEWLAVAKDEAGTRILVKTDDYKHAKLVAENVVFNDASRKVLHMGDTREHPIEWDFMNFHFKGYIDGIGDKAIFDLKTTPDADPRVFKRQIYDMGYYLQAAMYRIGSGQNLPHYLIAVDKKGGVSVHMLDERLVEAGMNEYTRLVTSFNECILSDQFYKSYDFWSPRYDGLFNVEKPAYLY